jgi:hypothetical protein
MKAAFVLLAAAASLTQVAATVSHLAGLNKAEYRH